MFRKTLRKVELEEFRKANKLPPLEYYDNYQEPLIASPAPDPPPAESFSGGSKTCANCNMNVPAGDETCWNCGTLFTNNYAAKLCPVCQTKVPGDAELCNCCGAQLGNVSTW